MTNAEAILRLKDHFAIHDDSRPTPYLDEAARKAYYALEIADRLERADAEDNRIIYDKCCEICIDHNDCAYIRRGRKCETANDFFEGYQRAIADIRSGTK